MLGNQRPWSIVLCTYNLSRSSRDEEPLVNAWVDRSRGKVLVGWDLRKLVGVDTAWGVLDGKIGAVKW
jgi:hypothetical protein